MLKMLFAACQDNSSYIWRSGSPCCENILASSDMDRRPSSVDTFLSHHHRPQEPSRWSSRFTIFFSCFFQESDLVIFNVLVVSWIKESSSKILDKLLGLLFLFGLSVILNSMQQIFVIVSSF